MAIAVENCNLPALLKECEIITQKYKKRQSCTDFSFAIACLDDFFLFQDYCWYKFAVSAGLQIIEKGRNWTFALLLAPLCLLQG